MPSFTKFNVFSSDLSKGNHKFGTDTFKVMLTNTLPVVTNTVKANITEIAAANGYTAGGPAITMTVSSTGAVTKITGADTTITATGAIATFRYAVIYNDTTASPVKPLVCFIDYGTPITMANGDTFVVDFDNTNGFTTVA